jgi:hypothetical protein
MPNDHERLPRCITIAALWSASTSFSLPCVTSNTHGFVEGIYPDAIMSLNTFATMQMC